MPEHVPEHLSTPRAASTPVNTREHELRALHARLVEILQSIDALELADIAPHVDLAIHCLRSRHLAGLTPDGKAG